MLDGMIWRFGLSRISLAINSQCYIGSIATARDPCRSRVVVNGNRRVNYYLKHLLVAARRAAVDVPLRAMQTCGTEDEHGKFSNASCFNRLLCPPRILQRVQAMSCIVKLQDPEIAIHPILVQLGDLVWKPCLQGRQWQFPPLVHARGRVCNDLMSTCIHGLRNDLVYWRFLRGLLTKSVCFSGSLSLSLSLSLCSNRRYQDTVPGVGCAYCLRVTGASVNIIPSGKLSLVCTAGIFMVSQSMLQYVESAGAVGGSKAHCALQDIGATTSAEDCEQ